MDNTNRDNTKTHYPTIEGQWRDENDRTTRAIPPRYPAPLPHGSSGPNGEYSGWCCSRCHCPQAVGAIRCPDCAAVFPNHTERHPAQPASPNPPGYKWSGRYGRYITQERADQDATWLMWFFGILFGVLLLFCLILIH
jgi:hypothetical protein